MAWGGVLQGVLAGLLGCTKRQGSKQKQKNAKKWYTNEKFIHNIPI